MSTSPMDQTLTVPVDMDQTLTVPVDMDQTLTVPVDMDQTLTVPVDVGEDVFDLDVALLEMVDPAGLVNVTDDGCTSTCGACVTGAA